MTIATLLLLLWALAALFFALRRWIAGGASLVLFLGCLAGLLAIAFTWSLFADQAPLEAFHDRYRILAFQEHLLALSTGYLAGFILWAGLCRLRNLSRSLPGTAFWLFHVGAGLTTLPQIAAETAVQWGLLASDDLTNLDLITTIGTYVIFSAIVLSGVTTVAVLLALITGRGRKW